MKTQIIKKEIEKAAKEANCTEVEIISTMQGELMKIGDEKSIKVLAKLKREYAGL